MLVVLHEPIANLRRNCETHYLLVFCHRALYHNTSLLYAGGTVESKALEHKRVKIDELHHDPNNARSHNEKNLRAIKASLAKWGQVEPLVVNKRNGLVVGGNGRLEAMRQLGWTEVDVVEVDLDNTQAAALAIALNRTAELAEWNKEQLGITLQALREDGFKLDDVGFEIEDRTEDLNLGREPEPEVEPKAEPEAERGRKEPEPQQHDREAEEKIEAKAIEAASTGGARRTLLPGDCLAVLRTLPDNSVDALVTDPPYGLSAPPDIREVLEHWMSDKEYEHGQPGFMGKAWDSFVPGPVLWKEVFRVLKPGAHGFVFAGTRTVDLMGIALRFAGFEVRDYLEWVYATGFPKNHDVSKAIDREAGAEREVVGKREGYVERDGEDIFGENTCGLKNEWDVTVPATEEAKKWNGWGTALKPAHEPALLIRKPLAEETVAANVKKWGTGAINIAGSRVGGEVRQSKTMKSGTGEVYGDYQEWDGTYKEVEGRWPSNLVIDEHAAAELDAIGGERRSGSRPEGTAQGIGYKGGASNHGAPALVASTGGASRFFKMICYCPKPSMAERNDGCEALPIGQSTGGGGMNDAEAGRKFGSIKTPSKNFHPTVKPIRLMEYLVGMITPPGGTVLDCFMGSGTTGIACGGRFHFIGIEKNDDYFRIASARMRLDSDHPLK